MTDLDPATATMDEMLARVIAVGSDKDIHRAQALHADHTRLHESLPQAQAELRRAMVALFAAVQWKWEFSEEAKAAQMNIIHENFKLPQES